MNREADDAAIHPSALRPHPSMSLGVIETDAFCEGCGFNLHTQQVWRDERLGIPVCRCPECGRHAAAGRATTSSSAWLRRLALAGLVGWLLVQLAFVLAVFGGMCGAQAAASEGLTLSGHMTRDGRQVLYRQLPNPNGITQAEFSLGPDQPFTLPASEVVYGKRLVPWLTGAVDFDDPNQYRNYPSPLDAAFMGGIFAAGIFVSGVAMASLAWFWRRGAKWLWLLVPLAASGLVAILIAQDSGRGAMWTGVDPVGPAPEYKLAAGVGALMMLTLAAGIAVGRRVTRLAVSVLIPPRSRQLVAFLWHCDGLAMPAPAASRLDG